MFQLCKSQKVLHMHIALYPPSRQTRGMIRVQGHASSKATALKEGVTPGWREDVCQRKGVLLGESSNSQRERPRGHNLPTSSMLFFTSGFSVSPQAKIRSVPRIRMNSSSSCKLSVSSLIVCRIKVTTVVDVLLASTAPKWHLGCQSDSQFISHLVY